MFESGHLSGGAAIYRRYPIQASIANPGIVLLGGDGAGGACKPATTTSFADSVGLGLESATYSTSQSALDDPGSDSNIGAYGTVTGKDMGVVVTVSLRPDLIIRALASGGATEGTALTVMTNTSASAGGTLITSTDAQANSMIGGTAWCISGNNVGHARPITGHTASVSVTVTVPFPRAIAVGDTFLMVPWAPYGDSTDTSDGNGEVQTSTLFTQADATIASGTGAAAVTTRLFLAGASDTFVSFIQGDHVLNQYTT